MNRLLRLNAIGVSHLRGDLYGGLTAAVVALPLALAMGVASGAGPVAGLYGAVCVGMFAALFGGTPSQISGPTGPMTIVSASVFTQFADRPALAFTVVMLAGLMQIAMGFLRIGRYINLMPYPVISGFMTGIGCILIIMQLDPILGYEAPKTVLNALTVLPEYLRHPYPGSVAVAAVSVLICFRTPVVIARRVPSPLIALLAGSALALALPDVRVLGAIPTGLPAVQAPAVDAALLTSMFVSAAVLATLGSIDSLLTSLVADNATGTFHDSDKELVGQGIGNLVAGLLGGIPGAGATIRTLTNIKLGGRTALSGALHATVLLAVVLGLGPVVAFIPHAALAGVLVKVGVDVIDWRFLRRLHRAPRADLVLMLVVLVLTVFVDVITAVAVGVVLASLAFVKQYADLQVKAIRTITAGEGAELYDAEERALLDACRGRALVLHLSGLMSFGAANDMARKMATIGHHEVVVVDLVDVPGIDGTAALALEEIIQRALDKGQQVVLVGLNLPVARVMARLGALERVRDTMRFADRRSALATAAALAQAAGAAD